MSEDEGDGDAVGKPESKLDTRLQVSGIVNLFTCV